MYYISRVYSLFLCKLHAHSRSLRIHNPQSHVMYSRAFTTTNITGIGWAHDRADWLPGWLWTGEPTTYLTTTGGHKDCTQTDKRRATGTLFIHLNIRSYYKNYYSLLYLRKEVKLVLILLYWLKQGLSWTNHYANSTVTPHLILTEIVIEMVALLLLI